MKKELKPKIILLTVLVLLSCCFMGIANNLQRDGGNVEITNGVIELDNGNLIYKLYKPKDVSSSNKAPAVLLLHGYQNDHETCAAYAIELSRRGYVVMSLDEYGHGASTVGLINRGYVNHKVTVNYGNDSEAEGTFAAINGVNRYKLMMNFSNLSFFNDYYSKDDDGNEMTDSSCGGIAAYAVLADLPYVDSQRMAVSGHSMGTWASWTVAAAYANTPIKPRATVLQCGELFRDSVYPSSITFDNVLLLQAKYDEFSYFRDYQNVVDDSLLNTPLRTEFLGVSNGQWNTTYGNFNDGSARRIELLNTNHRLTTHNKQGLGVALDWIDEATGHTSSISNNDIVAGTKETLTLLSMLCVLFAMFPLMDILLSTSFFNIVRPLPEKENIKTKKSWWIGAIITILLSGFSFPFMTQLGHGLLPLPENIFRMTIGNGFLSWYGLLIIIMAITNLITNIRNKKKGIDKDLYNRGLADSENRGHINWNLFLKSLLLALCMAGMVYIINWIYYSIFDLDLRYIWPFFRVYNGDRIVQFFVYIPIFALFYIMNNSKIMASFRTNSTYEEGIGGFLKDWMKNFFLMCGGVLIIVLIEYIPFFANIGPGADLLFGSTFGGPFMSLLILFVPQVMFFSIVGTICYRKTGSVYTGALLIAILACWIVTGGSSML